MPDPHRTGPHRVFTVPPGRPFLDCLARAILDGQLPAYGGRPPEPIELPATRLLLPTRRACRAMQEAFLRASKGRALLLPRIRPIAEGEEEASLIAGVLPPDGVGTIGPAIGSLERRLVLTQLVMTWSEAMAAREAAAHEAGIDLPPHTNVRSPAEASNLAADLARLMDMAETEEADLSRLKDIVLPEFAEHWDRTVEFLKIVTEFWPAHLAERGLLSAAARRRQLLDLDTERMRQAPPAGPVIVAGVTGSVPAAARLMRAVAELPKGCLVLPGLDSALPDDVWTMIAEGAHAHPQYRLVRLLASLGLTRDDVARLPGTETGAGHGTRIAVLGEAMRPPAATLGWQSLPDRIDSQAAKAALAGITYLEAASGEEEAEAVALILRQAAETPGRTAALVTPDRILGRRVVLRLESWGIRVDDSAGRPFAKTMPGAFLDLLITAFESDFAPAATMALLKHPLTRLGLPVPEVRRAARVLERIAFRRPYLGRGLGGIRAALEVVDEGAGTTGAGERRALALGLLERIEAAVAPLSRCAPASGPLRLSVLAAAHAAAAEAIAQDEMGSSAALWSEEAGEAASSLLAGLMDESLPQPSLDAHHYPELYRSLVAGEAVRQRVPTHPRISIWGPYEARLQQPDTVVIGSLNEGVWPEIAEPDAWLNRPMLEALGLPQPETRIGDLAHDFTALMGAKQVFLTRSAKIDGVPKVPSRWLLRLRAVLEGLGIVDALQGRADEPWLAWARNREAAGSRAMVRAPEPRPPVDARPRKLSVTRIEQWMANPYAVFARDILRLEPLPDLGAEPDAALRGLVIHRALNRFAQRFPEALPDNIADELERDLAAQLQDYAAHARVAAFWRPRFRRFAEWFAETEPTRRNGVAQVLSEIGGEMTLSKGHRPFALTARADRIDRLAAGGLVITDYKTGAPPEPKTVRELEAPQLPLEAAIAIEGGFRGLDAGAVAALRYIRVSGGEPPGEDRPIDIADIADLAAKAADGVSRLVARYDNAETAYRAVRRPAFAKRYRYDDYAHLARVKEWTGSSEDGDE